VLTVLATPGPLQPTDTPHDIASKHEVELAADALASPGKPPSPIADPEPDLDRDEVNYVVGHSDGQKLGGLDAKKLAERLVARGMKSGMVVRLVACMTGVDVPGKDPSLARQLATALHTEHKRNNIAVKGTLGLLFKTRRKADGPDGGVSGVYSLGKKHPRSDPALAKAQRDLMDRFATHLETLLTQATDHEYRAIQTQILDMFNPFEMKAAAEQKARNEIVPFLRAQIATTFKHGPKTRVKNTEDEFKGVSEHITAIAATQVGRKSLEAAQGKSFADLVNEARNAYVADCKTAIEDWLAGIAEAEGSTTTKLAQGNIAFRSGTPDAGKFSAKYTNATEIPAGENTPPVAGRLPQRNRNADLHELAEAVELVGAGEPVELVALEEDVNA
jgi:hypothetical protein